MTRLLALFSAAVFASALLGCASGGQTRGFRGGGPVQPNADNDGDTVVNAADNCPDKANPNQADTDFDGADGVGDVCDTCPDDSNSGAGQADFDRDGIGDLCDDCPDNPDPMAVCP